MIKITNLVIILIATQFATAQELFSTSTIPPQLLENANAVIRKNDVLITIKDYDKVEIVTSRVITVLNKNGLRDIKAGESYDQDTDIKSIEASIYDSNGEKIKRVKSKDFTDISAVSNGTLYSDNRVKYLEYIPRAYPFTVHFESKVVYNSTAFMPSWVPLEYFHASTESSTFKVINETNIEVKFSERNLEEYSGIIKRGKLDYEANNLTAIVPQAYSPDFSTYGPMVRIALKKFNMKGVPGSNGDWLDFGKWMSKSLLADVGALPQDVVLEIKSLTKDAKTQKEKAEIVYEFMQNRSRYISVQVGIGGWKPTHAKKVHEVAYGDCKGLSNYTKALLDVVGITSYHAIIYGDRNIRDIDKDFSSTQGNHMILYVPKLDDEKDIWLECTSKSNPFGYLAGWTDDRDALVITDEGGKIIHTTVYETDDNLQYSNALIVLKKDGTATAQIDITTSGYQYSFKEDLSQKSKNDLIKNYTYYWSYLNGLSINETEVVNDKKLVEVREKVSLSVDKYASKTGNLLLIKPVIFNRNQGEPRRYKERYLDFEIDRGYIDIDEYEIELEEGLSIDALPEKIMINSKFGTYELSVEEVEQAIKVRRYLKVNKGYFDKADYDLYRDFRSQIVKADNTKAVLKL